MHSIVALFVVPWIAWLPPTRDEELSSAIHESQPNPTLAKSDEDSPRRDPRTISLRLRDGVASNEIDVVLRAALSAESSAGEFRILRRNRLGIVDVELPVAADPARVASRIATDPRCEFAETNSFAEFLDSAATTSDPMIDGQWYLDGMGSPLGRPRADIAAVDAWTVEDGSPDVVIAVIDSGIEWTHPDLSGATWVNPRELLGNGIDDDGNGYIDDALGFDFGDDDPVPWPNDSHGTAIAGIAAAVGHNGIGIVGVAGGSQDGRGCRVMNLKIAGRRSASSVLDDAILYAIDHGARIVTLSIAILPSQSVHLALQAARANGAWVQCSAGNRGAVSYPASDPNVIAIGGTDTFDRPASFASGPQIQLAAPAVDLLTTLRNSEYGVVSGTSFAAPLVAGTVALLWSHRPDLTAQQLRSFLIATAEDILPPGRDLDTGAGRIDAAAALRLANQAIAPLVAEFGSGSPDSLGHAPRIRSRGEARAGSESFAIEILDAPAGLGGCLVIEFDCEVRAPRESGRRSRAPLFAATIPFVTDALGQASVPLMLPHDSSTAGWVLRARFVMRERSAPTGYLATRGLEVRIGS